MTTLRLLLLATVLTMTACRSPGPAPDTAAPASVRFATFNTSLHADREGGLVERLRAGDANAAKVAAVIQYQRPDVVLLNEFDYDESGEAARLFVDDYLGTPQHGQAAIAYPHRYLAPVNTGVPSGLDLDGNGRTGDGDDRQRGNDAWGYGLYPGQYGMLVLSKFPIDAEAVRSFRLLKWSAMPNARQPVLVSSAMPFYAPEVWAQLRLSSKSHWDVPIDTPLGRIHLLAAHPTPPVFDGPERRNAARNHDEIRLWADYLDDAPADRAWLCDDAGRCGGLPDGERFVIVGDYNADPSAGGSLPGAILQLLEHPRVVRYATPRSEGASAAAAAAGGAPSKGFPGHATADFGRSGRLRVDYVLPSVGLPVEASGVFWPKPGDTGADWLDASDHHLVWVDLAPPAP